MTPLLPFLILRIGEKIAGWVRNPPYYNFIRMENMEISWFTCMVI